MDQGPKTKEIDNGKVPLKAELVIQLKALQKDYEALKLENAKNLEHIQTLEIKVVDLETQTEHNDKEADTEPVEQTNNEKCEYVGEDEYDLDAHAFSEECDQHFTCYYCGHNLNTKAELMIHRKIEHEHKVKPCRNFSGGGCDLKDEDCWYIHIRSSCQEKPLTTFTCNICEKVFVNRREFMCHRKKQHVQAVPYCNKASSGKCIFGNENCWFQHNEIKKSEENENNEKTNQNLYNDEIIRKMFDMMESFTHRIVEMEKKTKDI